MANKDDIINEDNGQKVVNPNSALRWIEQAVAIIDKYGVIKIIQALLIILIATILVSGVINPNKVFELYERYREEAHQELIETRVVNTPKIQEACNELLYRSQGDRVLFMELHNNTGNISGMPFYYASASCESLDDNVPPIADQYSEVKLSLMPFATYLFENKYWSGDIEEVKKFDKSLYYRMMSNDVKHAAIIVVEGVNEPCGILILTYINELEKKPYHNCAKVKDDMERAAIRIAVLVEAHKYEK